MGAQRDIAIRLTPTQIIANEKSPINEINVECVHYCADDCRDDCGRGNEIRSEARNRLAQRDKTGHSTWALRTERATARSIDIILANAGCSLLHLEPCAARSHPRHTIDGNNQPTKIANAIDCSSTEQLRDEKQKRKQNEAHEQPLLPS